MSPDPTEETRNLYEGMATTQLEQVEAALRLDVIRAETTIAFARGRLILIAGILARRRASEV